jgi:hypothetical protein
MWWAFLLSAASFQPITSTVTAWAFNAAMPVHDPLRLFLATKRGKATDSAQQAPIALMVSPNDKNAATDQPRCYRTVTGRNT